MWEVFEIEGLSLKQDVCDDGGRGDVDRSFDRGRLEVDSVSRT